MDNFEQLNLHLATLLEYVKTTEKIRGYTVTQDLHLCISKEGFCYIISHTPTIVVLDENGIPKYPNSAEYLTTRSYEPEELARLIEAGELGQEFVTDAEEDKNN